MNKINCKVKLTNGNLVEINCEILEFKRKIDSLEPNIPFDNLLIIDSNNKPFSCGKTYNSNITFQVHDLVKILNQFTKLKIIINQFEQNKQNIEAEFSSKFRKYQGIEGEFEQIKMNNDSLKHENANLKQKLQILNEKFKEKTQQQIQVWEKQQLRRETEEENLKQIQQLLSMDKEQLQQKLKETLKKLIESHFIVWEQEKRILNLVTELSTKEEKLMKQQIELQNTYQQLQEEQKKTHEFQLEIKNWQSTIFKLILDNPTD